MLEWQHREFSELSTNELYDILALRQNVFNVEQQCTEPDIDYLDQKAIHLLGIQDNKLTAYLRLFLPGTKYPNAACIGRVLTAKSARGKGYGKAAMEQALTYLKEQKISAPIVISAQIYLEKFYSDYGFNKIGEPYEEAGIIHIPMRKDFL
ncbi:MAG: GNAT family N-acetyltransferase [Gammaproteobacteria bacterium]|nr:GNAT family N-acetyltransferase [Gammaproteobacteria bacterium]